MTFCAHLQAELRAEKTNKEENNSQSFVLLHSDRTAEEEEEVSIKAVRRRGGRQKKMLEGGETLKRRPIKALTCFSPLSSSLCLLSQKRYPKKLRASQCCLFLSAVAVALHLRRQLSLFSHVSKRIPAFFYDGTRWL